MPPTGIDVLAIIGDQSEPTAEDLGMVREVIEDQYRRMSEATWLIFFGKVKRKGWSRAKLLDTLDRFLERRYPNWVMGDFFGLETPMVFPHKWFTDRVAEDPRNRELIGCYTDPRTGGPCWGWIHELRDLLEVYTPPAPANRQLPAARRSEEEQRQIDALTQNGKLRVMVTDLRAKVKALETDLRKAEERVTERLRDIEEMVEGPEDMDIVERALRLQLVYKEKWEIADRDLASANRHIALLAAELKKNDPAGAATQTGSGINPHRSGEN